MKYTNPNKLLHLFKKLSVWEKVFYAFLLVIAATIVVNWAYEPAEGFANDDSSNKKLVVKTGNGIYDDFYSNVYDKLVFCKVKNDFEIGAIMKQTNPNKNSKILDIGSGTGHHVDAFASNGINAVGIDVSPSMVAKSKSTYPDNNYTVGNAMETLLFPQGSFTHITCLYFTIYYIEDKRTFLKNCYDWLAPGGFLALHLVDRDKFDPILPAGDPFSIISPQRYAKKRITSTVVKFKGYDYRSNFEYNPKKDEASLNEQFKRTDTGDVRKNEHRLFMPTQKTVLSMAKDAGFILHSQTDMMRCQYATQYIYILEKPN
tara:strand:+ start:272 stop:1219 length:948 start_codon:yes stop_codon:yes gene_type:complete